MGSIMDIYVVRHGQTDGNVNRVIDGIREMPLNDTGRQQAIKAGDLLKDISFDMVICSPLGRTKETMQLITNNKYPVEYDNRIIERDCGELVGKGYDEINFDKYWNYYDNTKYEKVESLQKLFERVFSFLDEIKEKYMGKKILVVTHGGVPKAIHCYFNGMPKDGCLNKVGLGNCEIVKYTV